MIIPDLPVKEALNDSDLIAVDDGQQTYKIAWGDLQKLSPGVSEFVSDPDTENYPGYLRITLANGTVLRAKPSDPEKQDKLTFDAAPTEGSANPVTSGGVFNALSEKLDAEDYVNFTGATESANGTAGRVPAPAAGAARYLGSSGAWETPDTEPTEDSVKLITSGAVKEALDGKVDKEDGKSLTSNDFTDALKTKLDGVETGANKTVTDAAMSDTSTNPVQNKVAKQYVDRLGFSVVNGKLCQTYAA